MKKLFSERRLNALANVHIPFPEAEGVSLLVRGLAQEVLDLRKQLQERSNNIPEKELQKVFKK